MTATASAHPVVPSLFVSHGAPLFAVDAGETGPALTHWGQALRAQFPGLRGVVVMSPHWMARGVRVTTGAQPATWHDFGGFPSALYELQREARSAKALAQEVLAEQAGIARSHMGKIERGEHMPTLAIIFKIAGALECSTAVLMAATAAGMLIFTGLSLAGFKRLGLQWVERYEETILGVALVLVGAAVAFFKT